MNDVIKAISDTYGPYAFSFVMLFVSWYVIGRPLLIWVEKLLRAQEAISKTNHETASMLLRGIDKLKELMDHRVLRTPPQREGISHDRQ